MQLIGMLDSPFVRRTAIGMSLLNLTFTHQSLSVFRDFEKFQQINPLVKAPTLLLDDGNYLIDSNLILQYAESIATESGFSDDLTTRQKEMHIIGIASIANEKTVQTVYEHELRPTEKRHQPWLDRVKNQLDSAFQLLENAASENPALFDKEKFNHAAIATAVAWFFTQHMRPGLIDESQYPTLKNWSDAAEETELFKRFPYDFAMSGG